MEPQELERRLGEFQILDVRELDEWEAGHIAGAIHIPLGELPTRMVELQRSIPIATICRSGSRSGKAAQLLGQRGLSATNVEGGMKRWHQAGLPMTGGGGRPRVA